MMKTIANIFTAAIIFTTIFTAKAGTTSFIMQTANETSIEVVSKKESELNEEIPNHHITVKEYIDLSICILSMPEYIEDTLDEEDFKDNNNLPSEYQASNDLLEIRDFVKEEKLVSTEMESIDTEAVFDLIMKKKHDEMLTAEALHSFIKTEKEINEPLPNQIISAIYIAK